MTPEQRSQLKVSEMESAIEERLKEMQAKLANLTGSVALSRENDSVTRRVLCVVGKRVLAFDPKTNLPPEVPKEVASPPSARTKDRDGSTAPESP
mgnify:CR=1 FL=1